MYEASADIVLSRPALRVRFFKFEQALAKTMKNELASETACTSEPISENVILTVNKPGKLCGSRIGSAWLDNAWEEKTMWSSLRCFNFVNISIGCKSLFRKLKKVRFWQSAIFRKVWSSRSEPMSNSSSLPFRSSKIKDNSLSVKAGISLKLAWFYPHTHFYVDYSKKLELLINREKKYFSCKTVMFCEAVTIKCGEAYWYQISAWQGNWHKVFGWNFDVQVAQRPRLRQHVHGRDHSGPGQRIFVWTQFHGNLSKLTPPATLSKLGQTPGVNFTNLFVQSANVPFSFNTIALN